MNKKHKTIMAKVKQPTQDEARMIYYSIRERLAIQLLSKQIGMKITNVSDDEGFESWDVIATQANGERQAIEIKVRKRLSTDPIVNDKWILEYRKYSALTDLASGEAAKKAQLQPIFLVFLLDKVVYWNMNDIKEEDFFIEELRASSVNGYTNTKPKKITHLSIQNGVEIDYVLDMDELDKKAKIIFDFRYPETILNLTSEQ